MKKLILFFIVIGVIYDGNSQAWVKSKGNFYAKFGVNSTNSNSIFDEKSEKISELPFELNNGKLPHLHELVFQIYGQYGISNSINILASLPYKSIKNLDNGFVKSGLADFELGLTYKLYSKTWQITPALMVGIPTGYYHTYGNNPVIYNSELTSLNKLLILGDGETNFMPRLYFGRGFSKPFYFTGFLGYNYRTEGRADEIDALIEGGYTLNKLIFILKLQIKESFYNGSPITYTGLYETGQEYLSPHFSIYYKYTKNLHFSLNVGGAVYARFAQHAPSINFGIAYEK